MSDKFYIKHDNIALLVNTMAVRLNSWVEELSEIKSNFEDFSSMEGFSGGSANKARNYCATYYGTGSLSSLPILLSEAAAAITESLLLYEKTYFDFDTVDKFKISEEMLDYIIQDAGVEAIGDFENVHESAIEIVNSISDIVELPKPDDTYYIQDSEDIVLQLENLKEDIYELEAAELDKIKELNEQVDSLLTLIESYSNKEKRVISFVSSDEIISSELKKAIEQFTKSYQKRRLNVCQIDEAVAIHTASMERIQKELLEEEKKKRKRIGRNKIIRGFAYTTMGIGCLILSVGTATPVVILIGGSFGTSSYFYGSSYVDEGIKDIAYASKGDIETQASNIIRDSWLFNGNQELFDLWGEINVSGAISMFPVGIKGMMNVNSLVDISSTLASETGALTYTTIASEITHYGVGKYCDSKDIDGLDKMFLQAGVSFVGTCLVLNIYKNIYNTDYIGGFEFDEVEFMEEDTKIWTGKDKYVPELANMIEQKYPGRVQGVEKIITGNNGKIITDLDIELDSVVIQVKSGSAKGLTSQMIRTAEATGKKVISYTPDISYSAAVLRGTRQSGFETFTTSEEILEYLANH